MGWGDFGMMGTGGWGAGILGEEDALLRLTHPTSDVLRFLGLWVEPLGNVLIDLL